MKKSVVVLLLVVVAALAAGGGAFLATQSREARHESRSKAQDDEWTRQMEAGIKANRPSQ